MDIQSRLDLVKQTGEEIVTEEELKTLLETKKNPIAYDGFEPSGQMHIAQGVMRAIDTNKLTQAGVQFKFWVADWFGWMNNKMGGDLDKIQTVGKYQIEVWKACGMDMDKVEFLWASDAMADKEYWKRTVSIARNSTVQRIIRCSQIMGRSESENLSAAQIFYPCMQASDIFHLKADITNLGMDQRKVNILAREIAPQLGLPKPVVISRHMLQGLLKPPTNVTDPVERATAMKMSKSNPDSAIFMTDSTEDIKRKIAKAYCPEKEEKENPLMEYSKYIIFEKVKEVQIERKFGGPLSFSSYSELAKAYTAGDIHPMDLKSAMAAYIDQLIKPVRDHFEKNKKAKELAEQVKSFTVTR
ncbi:MAG: tyrosine--tRNA ligase [Nanoarchaeota archaeon]